MKKLILVSAVFILALAPALVLAMDHKEMDHKEMDHKEMDHKDMDHKEMDHKDMDHKDMDHKDMKGMKHDGMSMHGDMMKLGTLVVDGVKATAHIKDVRAAMSKMGMEQTHHLMVNFVNDENDVAIDKGVAAVKVKNPDGNEAKPVKLIGMQGHFGADLALKEKGLYHFYVGTKLEDGAKRQFHFHTEVK